MAKKIDDANASVFFPEDDEYYLFGLSALYSEVFLRNC